MYNYSIKTTYMDIEDDKREHNIEKNIYPLLILNI